MTTTTTAPDVSRGTGDQTPTATTDLTSVTDTDTGRYKVTTESSTYILDLDQRTLTRSPGDGAGTHPEATSAKYVAALRRDAETLTLHELITLRVDASMIANIQVRDDDVTTLRRTTIVRHIERL